MDMSFTTIDDIIEQLESRRHGDNAPWIYRDGKIKDGIYTCDIIECLRGLTDFQIEKDSAEFDNVFGATKGFEDMEVCNTFNWNSNCTDMFEYRIHKTLFDCYVMMSFYVMGNPNTTTSYTQWVLFKFEDYEHFLDAFQTNSELKTENWNAIVHSNPWDETSVVTLDNGEWLTVWACERNEIINAVDNLISESGDK